VPSPFIADRLLEWGMLTPLQKDAREFWQACDTLIRFVNKYDGLINEQEREIVVTFVQAMAFDVAILAIDPCLRASHRFKGMDH